MLKDNKELGLKWEIDKFKIQNKIKSNIPASLDHLCDYK